VIATVKLLGLDFADLTAADAAEAIAAQADRPGFRYVVTPNADHFVRLSGDMEMIRVYQDAWLRLLDSRVVAGMASICRMRVPRVAPGSDVTRLLLERYVKPGERITVVGVRPVWLKELVARFGLAPPAHFDPPMGFDRDPGAFAETVSFVAAHPARFVFLAVGYGHRALHRREPWVSGGRGATGAGVDAAQRVGMGIPVGDRSEAAGTAVPGGQSARGVDAAAGTKPGAVITWSGEDDVSASFADRRCVPIG
jgi:hypothetical protein